MESLPPELIHAIALTGHLTPPDVRSLSLTCTTLASILTHDPYAHNLHRALLGVLPNACAGYWTAARYALSRRWFEGGGGGLWMRVAGIATRAGRKTKMDTDGTVFATVGDMEQWEDLLLLALSLPEAEATLEGWYAGYMSTSLLHTAACLGTERIVAWVVEQGGELGLRNTRHQTPLQIACLCGQVGVARLLVEAGVDVEASLPGAFLVEVAHAGHAGVVAFLLGLGLEYFAVDGENEYGMTALAAACGQGHMDVIHVLVDGGAELMKKRGKSPLVIACKGEQPEAVSFLLENGYRGALASDSWVAIKAFETAIDKGNILVLRLLVKNMGLEIDDVGFGAWTLLCDACRKGRVEVVRLLVEEGGADIHKPSARDETPVYIASMFGRVNVLKYLVDKGGDVNAPESDGVTPLAIACTRKHLNVVRLLLQSGADAEAISAYARGVASDVARDRGGYDDLIAALTTPTLALP